MSPSEEKLRIGQVCTMLRPEFSDVSISKLRFLEEQGLVMPERTPGGYRMYSEANIRQLRQILQMQRDEFLPLRVIRDELQRRVGATAPPTSSARARVSIATPPQITTRAELAERLGVSDALLKECEQYDLVRLARTEEGHAGYSPEDCAIVAAVARLQSMGIGPRNLRQLRSAAARQAALVDQFAATRLHTRNAEARAAAVREVEALADTAAEMVRNMFLSAVRESTNVQQPASSARPSAGPAAQSMRDAVTARTYR